MRAPHRAALAGGMILAPWVAGLALLLMGAGANNLQPTVARLSGRQLGFRNWERQILAADTGSYLADTLKVRMRRQTQEIRLVEIEYRGAAACSLDMLFGWDSTQVIQTAVATATERYVLSTTSRYVALPVNCSWLMTKPLTGHDGYDLIVTAWAGN